MENIININIEDELKDSYLDYAMSVIVGRALPDVRDGLKPVHRRTLYAMSILNNDWNKPYKKSARIVGDVIGKYHPHSDCLAGNVRVPLLDGTIKTIKDLYKENKEQWVLTYNELTDSYKPAIAHSFRIGQSTKKEYVIKLSNGDSIHCTSNHPFFIKGRGWVEAKDMVKGDKFEAGEFDFNSNYDKFITKDGMEFIHQLVNRSNNPGKNLDTFVCHHKNHNKKDNRPENLENITRSEHALHHGDYIKGLVLGREAMFYEYSKIRDLIRRKNSILLTEYNKLLPVIKGFKAVQYLVDSGVAVTRENYEKLREKNVIYNLTKLDTLEKRGYDLDRIAREKIFKLDVSKAKGLTFINPNPIKQRTTSSRGMFNKNLNLSLARIMEFLEDDIRNKTWEDFYHIANKMAKGNANRVKYLDIEFIKESFCVKTPEDLYRKLVPWALLSVESVSVFEHNEEIDFYDFTVDGTENMVILSGKENVGRDTFVVAHNSAVYDTIVRMAQPFSLRYTLVDGQGNFGSVDGDAAAAMRYTEVRMSKIAHELLGDLDKNTVDFIDNYDGSERIPEVLPTSIPNLLINGSSGIAVGMATNIPPHNLTEVIDGCIAYLDDSQITLKGLMHYIKGPDFPTNGIINGSSGIEEAYSTGRGKIYVRAKSVIEVNEKNDRETIIINELPYMVNKAKLIERTADLVKEKRIEGISAIRDESDKDGMRIVIELKKFISGEIILNNLYTLTQLQVSFGINMVALVNGQPKLLTLKEIIKSFINHRKGIVTRRSLFELNKAFERTNILEGLSLALDNIDEIITLIKNSPSPTIAKELLCSKSWNYKGVITLVKTGSKNNSYFLNEEQAQAILDLRLHRLTNIETDKLIEEHTKLAIEINELNLILKDPNRLVEVIREELLLIRDSYGDRRRTEIIETESDITIEDLIEPEDVVVTLSHLGYIKYQNLSEYEAQNRGGKGKSATKVKDNDFIKTLIVSNTHHNLLCFSSNGKVHVRKVYQLPTGSRASRGKPIVNLLQLSPDERITAVLSIDKFNEDNFIFMTTSKGTVKKCSLNEFEGIRSNGRIVVILKEEDELIGVNLTTGDNDVMIFSTGGKVVRFNENTIRVMGRIAAGVRGIMLGTNEKVVSSLIPASGGEILTVTENGYGKRTKNEEYPTKSRNTKGVIAIKGSERNGTIVGALEVNKDDEILVITNKGTMVRTRVSEISIVGRNTQGVRLIRTSNDEKVVCVERIIGDSETE